MDFGNSTIEITNQPANTNQTEENTVNTGEKPVTIAIFVCLGLVGCLGNGFVLIIFCSSEKLRQSIVNIYLINQSAIDLMASLTLIVTARGVTKSSDWSADRIQGKLYYFLVKRHTIHLRQPLLGLLYVKVLTTNQLSFKWTRVILC